MRLLRWNTINIEVNQLVNLPVLLDYAGIDSCNGIPIGIYDNLEEQTHSLQATRNSTEYA